VTCWYEEDEDFAFVKARDDEACDGPWSVGYAGNAGSDGCPWYGSVYTAGWHDERQKERY